MISRPYEPMIVKRAIVQRVANHPVTARQPVDRDTLIEVCAAFKKRLPGNKGHQGWCTEAQRHVIIAYLCDITGGSAKQLSQAQVRALIEWLAREEYAVTEMLRVLSARAVQLSQSSLDFEPAANDRTAIVC